jgi:hypothetical protein
MKLMATMLRVCASLFVAGLDSARPRGKIDSGATRA